MTSHAAVSAVCRFTFSNLVLGFFELKIEKKL
jgi:hypothetical protein